MAAGPVATQKVVSFVGELLPDKDQETILPEVVHDWLRSWIQGVEHSADRAGLILSGSISTSCRAMLLMDSDSKALTPVLSERGARRLLSEAPEGHAAVIDRVRELIRFALSREFLDLLP